MVASDDRSCRNKSAAKHFQKFLLYFAIPELSLLLLINVNSSTAVKVSQNNISLLHLIKILLLYQAPNKTPTLQAIPEKHKLIWV